MRYVVKNLNPTTRTQQAYLKWQAYKITKKLLKVSQPQKLKMIKAQQIYATWGHELNPVPDDTHRGEKAAEPYG